MTGLTGGRLLSIMLAAVSSAISAAAEPAAASTLRISTGSAERAANEVEADYTTSHVLISETAHQSVPITIFFDPQVTGVKAAEVFTNLNRRDWAQAAPNGDGVEEGGEVEGLVAAVGHLDDGGVDGGGVALPPAWLHQPETARWPAVPSQAPTAPGVLREPSWR